MRRRPIPLEAPSSRSTRGSEDTDLYVRARDEFERAGPISARNTHIAQCTGGSE
jgi:hypothetical protein